MAMSYSKKVACTLKVSKATSYQHILGAKAFSPANERNLTDEI